MEEASELSPSRFRFGGEKEAAGAAVAVLEGIMAIECGFVVDEMLFGDAIVADGDVER